MCDEPDLSSPPWGEISAPARQLVAGMLEKLPERRMTASEVRQWMDDRCVVWRRDGVILVSIEIPCWVDCLMFS